MRDEKILVLDFGGQYNQLIARRVRECNVYCEVKPFDMSLAEIKAYDPMGIIFTGGPNSVYDQKAPHVDTGVFRLGVPILGICYGCQLLAHELGGMVTAAQADSAREYGKTETFFDPGCRLFKGLPEQSVTWMSHGDYMAKVPEGFSLVAHSAACPTVGICDEQRRFYGVQFHPEVNHTEYGQNMIRNFLYEVCGASGTWTMSDYKAEAIQAARAKIGEGKVLLGLSGGVDSSVCAALLSRAIPGRLTCIYIDHGFMRKNETEEVRAAFAGRALDLRIIDASEQFFKALEGVTDSEEKRKRIGREFVRAFEKAARDCGNPSFLAQGTIYPDVVESGSKNKSAVIKSHHNVGGLPKDMSFEGVVEPLRGLFKDEVRALGRMLGLPKTLVERQPFPGPGLAIRVIGEVTCERLHILREADAIVREEIRRSRVKADQYFCVLTNVRSVGVMGDFRTYDYTLAIRAVRTNDFMTCEYARLPHTLLSRMSTRITNEVQGVNRVVYDITGKPPATIEWE